MGRSKKQNDNESSDTDDIQLPQITINKIINEKIRIIQENFKVNNFVGIN